MLNAYDEGREAYIRGEKPRNCPYNPYSHLGVRWIRGNVQEHNDEQDAVSVMKGVKP